MINYLKTFTCLSVSCRTADLMGKGFFNVKGKELWQKKIRSSNRTVANVNVFTMPEKVAKWNVAIYAQDAAKTYYN